MFYILPPIEHDDTHVFSLGRFHSRNHISGHGGAEYKISASEVSESEIFSAVLRVQVNCQTSGNFCYFFFTTHFCLQYYNFVRVLSLKYAILI